MNMKRIACILALVVVSQGMVAQPKKVVLSKEEGRITFAVDDVELPESHCGWKRSGMEIAQNIHLNEEDNWDSDWKPEILACSFDGEDDLYTVGEDVLFQMLKKAWSQHRPVVLTPDAIWLVICHIMSMRIAMLSAACWSAMRDRRCWRSKPLTCSKRQTGKA